MKEAKLTSVVKTLTVGEGTPLLCDDIRSQFEDSMIYQGKEEVGGQDITPDDSANRQDENQDA